MNRIGLSTLLLPCLVGWVAPASAVDCTVNVLDAYNIAKPRGWSFSCEPGIQLAGVIFGFVTYPPDGIGCVFKTPSIMPPQLISLGKGRLFSHTSDALSRPNLKNGWTVKSFEIYGGLWQAQTNYPKTQVNFRTTEPPKQNRTYNYNLRKLVLTHPTGNCANALNEAF